jgi:hypothetical protein
MDTSAWLASYAATSLLWLWILRWGGAEWLEGWKSMLLIDYLSHFWTAEQIKLYALLCWLGSTLWFVAGLLYPEYRYDFWKISVNL